MRMSTQSPYEWRNLNRMLKQELGCEANVFVYRGLHQALFETCFGLHLRFNHKRKIVAETGFGDHLKSTEMELARMGVRIKSEFSDDMAKEEKETLAYIHDLDDSITGELYNHIDTLKALTQTKMYRIHVAHHLFHIKKTFIKNLSEYDIMVCGLSEDYALVFTGEKVTLPLLVVGQLSWSQKQDGHKILELIKEDHKLYQPEIVGFESSLPEGVAPWFTTQPANRIYDRAVVILKNHDASAMRELMLEELQLESQELGAHCAIEAASYCRWQNDTWFEQAEKFGRSPEDMGGLLLVDGKIINDQFKQVFNKCLDKLESLSS